MSYNVLLNLYKVIAVFSLWFIIQRLYFSPNKYIILFPKNINYVPAHKYLFCLSIEWAVRLLYGGNYIFYHFYTYLLHKDYKSGKFVLYIIHSHQHRNVISAIGKSVLEHSDLISAFVITISNIKFMLTMLNVGSDVFCSVCHPADEVEDSTLILQIGT